MDDKIYDKGFVANLTELLLHEKNNNIRNGLYDLTQTMMSYHSNRIEGSTLSYDDTWELYDKGSFFSKELVRSQDITDAQGHFLMFDKMLSTLDKDISKDVLCEWHYVLKSGSYMDRKRNWNIGQYKKLENAIGGLLQTVPVDEVENEMESYFGRYYDRASLGHTMQSLAIFHHRFEMIHPFQDGNGRIGRMLLFRQCLDNGLVPCVITEELSSDYKDALKEMSFVDNKGDKLKTVFEKASLNYRELSERFVRQFEMSENVNRGIRQNRRIH